MSDHEPIERQVIRVLFILYFCSDTQGKQLQMFVDYTHAMYTEGKLQKFDFWVRYPDHLAAALIEGCKPQGELTDQRDEVKAIVRTIFRDQEPVLRWVPMRRFLRGAYEPLDDLMAYLTSRWLAYRRIAEKRHRTEYFLTPKGRDIVERLLAECPETVWYAERCKLLNSFYGHLTAFEVRKLQYLVEEYGDTPYWQIIRRIESKVQRLFADVFGEPL
jgi:hypothetical protein